MIEQVVAHLAALKDKPAFFKQVDFAFTAKPLEDPAIQQPSVYVFPFSYRPFERMSDNRVDQREEAKVGIHLVCEVADFELRRKQVNDLMMGYQYGQQARMFEADDADVLGIKAHLIWFQLVFRTSSPVGYIP